MNLPKLFQILAFSLFLTACDQSVKQDTLTIYTSRQPQLIEPILDKYTEATGIDIVLLSGNAQQLLERIEVEGKNLSYNHQLIILLCLLLKCNFIKLLIALKKGSSYSVKSIL